MQLVEKLSLVTARLGDGLVSGLVLIGIQQAVVRNERLGPDATYVVLAARDSRIGKGAARHNTANLTPIETRHCLRKIQINKAVLQCLQRLGFDL